MKKVMKQFKFSVIGRPVAKQRARVFGGGGRVSPTEWAERMIRGAFRKAYPNKKPFGSTFCNWDNVKKDWVMKKGVKEIDLPKLQMDLIFYFVDGKIGDVDNLQKCVKDALNKVAYIDDKIIKKTIPYVILLTEHEELYEEDYEDFEKAFGMLERVDILIKPFKFEDDEYFKQLRKEFKGVTCIDHLFEYKYPYGTWRKGDLEDECDSRDIKFVVGRSRQADTKETLIKKLVAYDKKEYELETGKPATLMKWKGWR